MTEQDVKKKIGAIIALLSSGYVFSNSKTDFSVDFRVCPLMTFNENGNYTSKVCTSCYAAVLLNVYPNVRKKVESLPPATQEKLKQFENDMKIIKTIGNSFLDEVKKIRFYSLSDFGAEDIPFIHVASKYFIVDIISKSLVMKKNEEYLISLFNKKNVSISLSFNSLFMSRFEEIKELVIKHKANNVQFNYTMLVGEENPRHKKFEDFQVLHFRNENKRSIARKHKISEKRVCALFDRDGKRVENHGHCHNCNNCHISYLSTQKLKKKPRTLTGNSVKKSVPEEVNGVQKVLDALF